MKSPFSFGRAFSATAGVLLLCLLASSCSKKPETVAQADIAPKTPALEEPKKGNPTFYATTKYLDEGGDLYAFLRTEQVLAKIPEMIANWKSIAAKMPSDDPNLTPELLGAYFDALAKAAERSGITQLRGGGISSYQLEEGLSRTTMVAYSGERTDPGLLWKLGGKDAPHKFAVMDFLPDSTALVSISDFDFTQVWKFIQETVSSLPEGEPKQQMTTSLTFAGPVLGMPLDEFCAALGDQAGILITVDPAKKMQIPTAQETMELPEMGAALLFHVKDDKMYDLISTKLDQMLGASGMEIQTVQEPTLKMRVVNMPQQGLPLKPAVGRFGEYLVISSTDHLARQLARTGEGLPGLLKDDPEFKALASREPAEMNSFGYMSRKGTAVLKKIQTDALDKDATMPEPVRQEVRKMYDLFSQDFSYTVGRLEKDAWVGRSYSDFGSAQIATAAAAAPTALLAAIAVPSFLRARERSQATTMKNDLRLIDAAIDQNAIEKNLAEGTVVKPSEIAEYLKTGTRLQQTMLDPEGPKDLLGNPYGTFVVDKLPAVPAATAAKVLSTADAEFWSPFPVGE